MTERDEYEQCLNCKHWDKDRVRLGLRGVPYADCNGMRSVENTGCSNDCGIATPAGFYCADFEGRA